VSPGGAFGKQEGGRSMADTRDQKLMYTSMILERSVVRVHLIKQSLLPGFGVAIGSD